MLEGVAQAGEEFLGAGWIGGDGAGGGGVGVGIVDLQRVPVKVLRRRDAMRHSRALAVPVLAASFAAGVGAVRPRVVEAAAA